jgi:hypothetical protein
MIRPHPGADQRADEDTGKQMGICLIDSNIINRWLVDDGSSTPGRRSMSGGKLARSSA